MTITLEPSYSGAASSLTWTLAGLANGSYRQCTAVDNSAVRRGEILVNGYIKTGASGVLATGSFAIYAFSYDGTNYTDGAGAADAAFTPDNTANLVPVCTRAATANASKYYFTFQLVAASGWLFLPQQWGLIMANNSGAAFDATAGNFLAEYQGLQFQGV